MNRALIKGLIEKYENALSSADASADDPYKFLQEAQAYCPNADLISLYFHSETERSIDEMIDEAALREAIFEKDGLTAVRSRMVSQMCKAFENPDSSFPQLSSAFQILKGYAPEKAAQYNSTLDAAAKKAIGEMK